jgi:hypothetical protein
MTWLLWRQHRMQALVTGVLLGAFAVFVVVTGIHMAHQYDDVVRGCSGSASCGALGNLFQSEGAVVNLVHLSIVVPAVLGILGAVLVARETEQATDVLVWTQTVTRRRWTFSKVVLALGATLLVSVALSALVTWWSGSPNSLYGNRFEGAQFDTQNVVPIAVAMFAVALGLAAGAVLRRTLPAIATTLGVFVVTRVVFTGYVRPHLLPTVTRSFLLAQGGDAPSGSWTVGQHAVDAAGHDLGTRIAVPGACRGAGAKQAGQCLNRLGYHYVVTYHPPSQYWQMQWIESGIFAALAAVLVAVAVVRTRRGDA